MSNIIFKLQFPPSVNSKYEIIKRKRVKSAEDRKWIHFATIAINQQNIMQFNDRCYVVYELCYPDNRGRDAANYEKKVTDLLVSLNILQGDDRRYVKGVFIYWNDTPGDYITVRLVSVDEFDLNSIIN